MSEQSRSRALAEIVQLAEAMRDGRMSFIEGARAMIALSGRAGLNDDEDVRAFVLIESETDALPMGDVRKLWRQDALERLQPEITRAEVWARENGLAACEALIGRFKSGRDARAPRTCA